MDVGNTNGWRYEVVVPSAEVMERIDAEYPLADRVQYSRAAQIVEPGAECVVPTTS